MPTKFLTINKIVVLYIQKSKNVIHTNIFHRITSLMKLYARLLMIRVYITYLQMRLIR